MMLPAATVMSVLLASTLLSSEPAASTLAAAMPPMIVNVTAAPDMAPDLVARILAEADRIWRPSGVTFVWRRAPRVVVLYSRASETGPYVPNTLRLNIGDSRGTAASGRLPLGWIVFDEDDAPAQEIYLSRANGQQMMSEARGVIGIVEQMTLMQRDVLLARAMGRALAHELGHYLLASKSHSAHGLMKAVLGAVELFSMDSGGFRLDPVQRQAIAARLKGAPLSARR